MEWPKPRKSGLSWPPSFQQVASLVGLGLEVGAFYTLVLPNIKGRVREGVTASYTALLVAVIVAWVGCVCTDPSDKGVKERRGARVSPSLPSKRSIFCVLCASRVNPTSRHCGVCNRCTDCYDHHCDWLNNCIGRGNYRWFLALISAFGGLMMLHTSVSFVLTREVSVGEGEVLERYDVGDGGVCFVVGLIAVDVVSVMITIFLAFLLCFHIHLRVRSMTTYEFFLRKKLKLSKVTPSKQSWQTAPSKAHITSGKSLEAVESDVPVRIPKLNIDETA